MKEVIISSTLLNRSIALTRHVWKVKDSLRKLFLSKLVLENLKIKKNHRFVIGNFNTNSISNKINLFIKSIYRLDRNRNGGGAFIYLREDIPIKDLKASLTNSSSKILK